MFRGFLPSSLERNLPRLRWGLALAWRAGLLVRLLVDPDLPPEAHPILLVLAFQVLVTAVAFHGLYAETAWGRGFALGTLIEAVVPLGPRVQMFGLLPLDLVVALLLFDDVSARRHEAALRYGLTPTAQRYLLLSSAGCAAMASFSFGSFLGPLFFLRWPVPAAVLLGSLGLGFYGITRRAGWAGPVLIAAGGLQLLLLVLLRV